MKNDHIPSHKMAIERTDTIDILKWVDAWKAAAPEARASRRLAAETVQNFKQSNIVRAFVSKQYGGLEINPSEFFRQHIGIAQVDMSLAWVAGIYAVHGFQISLMDDRAQRDVYGVDPNICVSSSYNPVGARVSTRGQDFLLHGRWGWSSGADHADWVLLGGIVPEDGYRTFLVPRSDYRIDDTWHSMGLQATGSNDIVIQTPVVVPAYRTHRQMDGFNCQHRQRNPLYGLPWAQLFVAVVAVPAIGAARHALAVFCDACQSHSTDPTKLAGDPEIASLVAEVYQNIESAESLFFSNMKALVEAAMAQQTMKLLQRVQFRYQSSCLVPQMLHAVSRLFSTSGGRSVFTGSQLQDIWHDIHTARFHVANNPTSFRRNLGQMILGGENKDVFV